MADGAVLGGGYMTGVLTRGGRAIVAAAAGTHHIRMIDADDRYPCRVAMAILANIVACDVTAILAGGCRSVMAADTTAGNAGVVEGRW